jgi:hypothetical protein
MNKKGSDWIMIVVGVVIAIVFLLISMNALGWGIAKPLNTLKSCPYETRCWPTTDGCPGNEIEYAGRSCKDSSKVCCITPEEQANLKKVSQYSPSAPSTSSGGSGTTGNSGTPPPTKVDEVKIQEGDDTGTLGPGASISLPSGKEKQFKIWVVGPNAKLCTVQLLDSFSGGNSIKPSWFNGGGEIKKVDCSNSKIITVSMTPLYSSASGASNQYKMDVLVYNATEDTRHASASVLITVSK